MDSSDSSSEKTSKCTDCGHDEGSHTDEYGALGQCHLTMGERVPYMVPFVCACDAFTNVTPPLSAQFPDCELCDHAEDAHSGDSDECDEQLDGEDCRCPGYMPKGVEEVAPCRTCGEPWHKRHRCDEAQRLGALVDQLEAENGPVPDDVKAQVDAQWPKADPEPPAVQRPVPLDRLALLGVAYQVGNTMYEVLVHPDAQVRLVNGVLEIGHGAEWHKENEVTSIVQVRTVLVGRSADS